MQLRSTGAWRKCKSANRYDSSQPVTGIWIFISFIKFLSHNLQELGAGEARKASQ